ncbi:MAG: DUF177 domain-containing protein [Clostridiales bacterium]|nr:DUF177 domain-containing protein [Clostridiales bacterium]
MVFELEPVFNNIGYSIPVDYSLDLSSECFNSLYPFKDPVTVKGEIKNEAGIVLLKASAAFTMYLDCDRCAAPITRRMIVPLEHVLVTTLNDETNDELILIESLSFEADDLIRDDIFLSMPSKFLCREDCKGLCPSCGKNLNEGPCSCKKPVDPRLEALTQLLDK